MKTIHKDGWLSYCQQYKIFFNDHPQGVRPSGLTKFCSGRHLLTAPSPRGTLVFYDGPCHGPMDHWGTAGR